MRRKCGGRRAGPSPPTRDAVRIICWDTVSRQVFARPSLTAVQVQGCTARPRGSRYRPGHGRFVAIRHAAGSRHLPLNGRRVGAFTPAREALTASAAPQKPDDLLHRSELTLRANDGRKLRRQVARLDAAGHLSITHPVVELGDQAPSALPTPFRTEQSSAGAQRALCLLPCFSPRGKLNLSVFVPVPD